MWTQDKEEALDKLMSEIGQSVATRVDCGADLQVRNQSLVPPCAPYMSRDKGAATLLPTQQHKHGSRHSLVNCNHSVPTGKCLLLHAYKAYGVQHHKES
jgi:hypothetical protein